MSVHGAVPLVIDPARPLTAYLDAYRAYVTLRWPCGMGLEVI